MKLFGLYSITKMDTKNFSDHLTSPVLGAINILGRLSEMTDKEHKILEIISEYLEFYFKEFDLDKVYLSRYSIFCHFNFHKKLVRNNINLVDIKNVIELMVKLDWCDAQFNASQTNLLCLQQYLENNPRGSKLKIWWKSLWK